MSNLRNFEAKIHDECIDGSSIALVLCKAAIAIVPDTEIDSQTKEVISFPIDEALGRKPTRFGHDPRYEVNAALFNNENGSTWQAKLSRPKVDCKKTTAAFKKALGLVGWDIEPRFWSLVKEHPKLVVYRK